MGTCPDAARLLYQEAIAYLLVASRCTFAALGAKRARPAVAHSGAVGGGGPTVEPEEYRAAALQAKCHAYLARAEALRVQTLEMRQTRTRADMLAQAQQRIERVKQDVSTEAELPPYVSRSPDERPG